MSEVFIDTLEVENFGPFYGEHHFDFRAEEGKVATLIGGKNGAGKTHLLRALYLAAVGSSGAVDLKKLEAGSDTTRFSLEESLNRKARKEGTDACRLSITLSKRDGTGTTGRAITIHRRIKFRPASPPSFSSQARLSGDSNWTEDEDRVQRLRDAFLPRHLARFFFFDAERGQSVQLGEREITEGISRVLGLYSYSELEDDLRYLSTNKIPRTFGAGTEAERKLNDIQVEIIKVEKNLQVSVSEEEDLRRQLRDDTAALAAAEDELKSLGAIDPAELEKAQKQREEIAQSRARLQTVLESAWDAALPLALLGPYRHTLHDYLITEESRRDWESKRSSVEPRIPQVLDGVFRNVDVPYALADEQRSYYESRLVSALKSLFHPPPAGMSDRVFVTERSETSAQVRLRLQSSLSGIGELSQASEDLEKKTAELRELDQRLKQLQQNVFALQRGAEVRERRDQLIQSKERIEKRLGEIVAERVGLETRLKELKREEANQNEIVQRIKKGKDLHGLAQAYREAVGEIKQRAAVQLREQVSRIVGERWLEITERGDEFLGMEFDQLWSCYLLRRDGTKQLWEQANTSAGQRQVRILAFTEALRGLARLAPPLVVDTPLGRLDKEVKESVLERLYLAGHQSIVLSTNSEIDPAGGLFDRISPKLARVYTLTAVGDPESSSYEVRVTSEYFKRVL
jgi:DNA sulfur modification protein DndD